MKQDEIEQLKAEINHIFESGANEIRILNMVKTFIERRYESIDLLSKKPSVSDEEIKEIAREYSKDKSSSDVFREAHEKDFIEGVKWALSLTNPECNGNCGMNHCDTNGCNERKRILVEPPTDKQVVQSEVSGYTLQNIEEAIEFGLQYSFDQKRVHEYNRDKDAFINSLTPPDAEAVMFAEWIYKNYISNGIGKYYHNNWNGDLDTLVNYTTQELFNLYKQGG